MNLINEVKKLESMINSKLKNNHIEVRIIESKDGHDGKIIILKNEKVNRVFAIDRTAYKQISISENNETLETGMFIDNLGAWIFNLFNNVKYLYAFYGGELNRKVFTRKQVEKIAIKNLKNKEKTPVVDMKRFGKQPKMEGYLGPVLGKMDYGLIYLRYETQEIYNMLSA